MEYFPGTKYGNEPCHGGFLKWWIKPSSVNKIIEEYDMEPKKLLSMRYNYKKVIALDYEKNVYKDIIRPLIDYNICPNFIRYLGSGEGCNIDDMYKMLIGKTSGCSMNDLLKGKIDSNCNLISNEIFHNLKRNLTYMLNGNENRPSINKVTIGNPKNTDIVVDDDLIKEIKCNLLIVQLIRPMVATKFSRWFVYIQKASFNNTTLRVIFQVVAGCYAMALSKMTHNDLHYENIWVERLPIPKNITYILNGISYTFINTEHNAMIFDFDRSYVQRLGKNILLSDDSISSQQNTLISNKDVIKIFWYLYEEKIMDKFILKLLCPNDKSRKFLTEVYMNGPNLVHPKTGVLSEKDYAKFRPIEDIIYLLSQLMSQDETGVIINNQQIASDTTYICNKEIFEIDGSINITTLERQRNEL
jgi:hypothetical protein